MRECCGGKKALLEALETKTQKRDIFSVTRVNKHPPKGINAVKLIPLRPCELDLAAE